MLYMVECAFTDPAREAEWNAYYDAEKLANLLALPGFRASQRFRAVTETPSPYLAIHSVRDASVFERQDYRTVGGGTFDGWEHSVTNWRRNLFAGMEAAPEVGADARLVLIDDPDAAAAIPGTEFAWLDVAGLDRSVARRGFAVVDANTAAALTRDRPDAVSVYEPITGRRVSPHGIDN